MTLNETYSRILQIFLKCSIKFSGLFHQINVICWADQIENNVPFRGRKSVSGSLLCRRISGIQPRYGMSQQSFNPPLKCHNFKSNKLLLLSLGVPHTHPNSLLVEGEIILIQDQWPCMLPHSLLPWYQKINSKLVLNPMLREHSQVCCSDSFLKAEYVHHILSGGKKPHTSQTKKPVYQSFPSFDTSSEEHLWWLSIVKFTIANCWRVTKNLLLTYEWHHICNLTLPSKQALPFFFFN